MATDYPKATKRYLVLGDAVHQVYETEDGHHRTRCGVITRAGELVRARRPPRDGKLCRACCEAWVAAKNYVCGDGEGVPYRPVKTSGRKRRGSVSGTTAW